MEEMGKYEVGGGTKYDNGKPRTDLLDYVFIEGIARVLAFGAKKYADENWRQGIGIKRLIGAALRHTFKFLQGEDNDPESGESHLYHAGCCLMFAAWTVVHKPSLDDRWKAAPSKRQAGERGEWQNMTEWQRLLSKDHAYRQSHPMAAEELRT